MPKKVSGGNLLLFAGLFLLSQHQIYPQIEASIVLLNSLLPEAGKTVTRQKRSITNAN